MIIIFILINQHIMLYQWMKSHPSIYYSKIFLEQLITIIQNKSKVYFLWNSMVSYLSTSNLVDSALHLLIGCIIGIGCLMVIITSILCLYGYYKCRRRQFRLFTERQTFKFKYDINSYRWLGQQPSISSSSPYLIQSTSIWLGICLELFRTIIAKDFIPKYLVICMSLAISRIELMLL